MYIRTEVIDFDPLFNAITGLNGSGKSNILDSICFYWELPICHRASNLQDLASVSITFDNFDKKQSPLGFENHDEITVTRQVVIGGRNKYLINGVNANNTRVQDLFCSVGLNVNNPHFLIMQVMYIWTITKVLNMKPPEILAMIEEAAGTRMYECKKLAAQKLLRKRIHLAFHLQILEEEITPTLQKLKEERSSYLEYQKVVREIEHLNRLYVVSVYSSEETKLHSADVLKEMESGISKLKEEMTENEKKVKELSKAISEMEKKRDQECGGALQSLEEALTMVQRTDAKVESTLAIKKQNLQSEENKRKELVKAMEEDSKALALKEKEVKNLRDALSVLQEKNNKDTEALAAAQQHFNAVSAGLSSSEDGEDATLAGQMMTCKNDISKAETEAKQAQMKLNHAQKELKTKQSEVKKMDEGYKKDQESFEAARKQKEKLEHEMKKLNYEDKKEEHLLEKQKELSRVVNRLRESYENFLARFPNLRFEYRNPETSWNPDRVKGLVASLITVKDVSTATALEVVAGGRLYNVVVDTEVTGKKLLEKGELKRRYTIIPLNKISSRCIGKETIKVAKNLVGDDNVNLALSLVGYDSEIQKAMEYVFGQALVCDNMDNAKRVTFDKRIMTKTVTLGGDTFDPQGTLSGGARSQAASVLSKIQEMKEAQDELKAKEAELQTTGKEIASLQVTLEKYHQLKQQWEMKSEEADLLQTKLQQSTYHKHQEELDTLKKTIGEKKRVINTIKPLLS
uniref:SMC hinge domain-containing protein n=1 Tax=Naja naja TaxID=35670 RepID=A0A8C6XIV8_NAJNA